MKNSVLGFVLLLSAYSCNNQPQQKAEREIETKIREIIVKEGEEKNIATLEIDGMSCEVNCANKIQKTLSELKGVKSCTVNFEDKMAEVIYDDSIINEKALVSEIEKLNENQYTVKQIEIEKTIVSQVDMP